MDPTEPIFTAHNSEAEPWRLRRLVRIDGRVRELLRVATPEAEETEGCVGEHVWAQHVRRLHDQRGLLQAHVTARLGNSAWLSVIALVLSRAWDSEDEGDIEFLVEGEPLPWPAAEILPHV